MWRTACFIVLFMLTSSLMAYGQSEWAGVFPDIKGCVKTVGTIERVGSIATQTAVYDFPGYENFRESPGYMQCGTITLRLEPGGRAAREKNWADYFPTVKKEVQGFSAWQNSPLCGNDPWLGSLEVYFSDDKVLIASANTGGETILKFAEEADYIAIENVMRPPRP